jgi:uncharacterized protein (UPF0276 family)
MTQELGVGLTYHPALADFVAANEEAIDVLEVDSTSWLGRSREEALWNLERMPCAKVVRGNPIGGSRLPDPPSLVSLRDLTAGIGARWITGELGFHRAQVVGQDFDTGLLLPLRQTVGGARLAAHSARSIRGELRAPLALEVGKNYLKRRRDEISQGEFLAEVAEDADCGILLDLGSLWINAANGRQAVADFLNQIPRERVWGLRLGSGNRRSGYGFGARPGAILEALIEIAAPLVPRLPNLRALVFEIHPDSVPRLGASGLSEQLRVLRSLWQERRTGAGIPSPRRRSIRWSHERGIAPREWEDALGGLVVGGSVEGALAEELLRDPGLTVFRRALAESRASMISRHLPLTSRLLTAASGTAFLRSILEAYWRKEPPSPHPPIEALGFAWHLARLALDVPYLSEVLEYERAVIGSYLDGEKRVVRFQHDPEVVLRALAKGRLPGGPRSGSFEMDVASA